ncbi:MAG TPA: hypothetical protein VIH35_07475 [Kiritimatiellia bacterium]|jgi:hypothetical protein
MKRRLHTFIFFALTLASVAQTNTPAGLEGFADTFNRVVELVDAEELSSMEVAKGTYHATKLFATGTRAVPYAEQRFADARKESEAAVAGLYMTVHGQDQQLQAIQQGLETSAQKRTWLKRDVGTEQAFFETLEAGAYWEDFFPLLPSAHGVLKLSRMCVASKDALVRRAGLLWSYTFKDAGLAGTLKQVAAADPDPVTRKIAARLAAGS